MISIMYLTHPHSITDFVFRNRQVKKRILHFYIVPKPNKIKQLTYVQHCKNKTTYLHSTLQEKIVTYHHHHSMNHFAALVYCANNTFGIT